MITGTAASSPGYVQRRAMHGCPSRVGNAPTSHHHRPHAAGARSTTPSRLRWHGGVPSSPALLTCLAGRSIVYTIATQTPAAVRQVDVRCATVWWGYGVMTLMQPRHLGRTHPYPAGSMLYCRRYTDNLQPIEATRQPGC